MSKRSPRSSGQLKRSGSSSSSSDEETAGHKHRLENAQNKKRELCDKILKDHFHKKKIALFDTKARSEFVSLLKEQADDKSAADEKRKAATDQKLFKSIEKIQGDEKVWRQLNELCDQYLNTVIRQDGSIMKEATQAVLMCIL